ncbi:DUF1488 domain-containing protein [Pseudenterobacter timonensis]|uniref:DUF1488 domain-containing protein n=1 Tax=Pseudenterobacter timonensis TaxID=1755099 RepID=A0ABV4ABS3_9ENTR
MNQAIQFPDREIWDEAAQAVCFPALMHGMQLTCAISGESLRSRFGENDPLESFRLHRWDLEEEASDAISDQQEDERGWFWLS